MFNKYIIPCKLTFFSIHGKGKALGIGTNEYLLFPNFLFRFRFYKTNIVIFRFQFYSSIYMEYNKGSGSGSDKKRFCWIKNKIFTEYNPIVQLPKILED